MFFLRFLNTVFLFLFLLVSILYRFIFSVLSQLQAPVYTHSESLHTQSSVSYHCLYRSVGLLTERVLCLLSVECMYSDISQKRRRRSNFPLNTLPSLKSVHSFNYAFVYSLSFIISQCYNQKQTLSNSRPDWLINKTTL